MTVCVCKKVSKEKIEQLVEDGAEHWLDASAECGAGRYCGACLKRFRELFNEARLAKAVRNAA